MGLEIASGLNATVTNCTVTGSSTSGGTGISIFGVTGNATVQSCIITTNSGGGLEVTSAGFITVVANIFAGNSNNYGGGGADCNGQTIMFTGNNFIGNSGRLAVASIAVIITPPL